MTAVLETNAQLHRNLAADKHGPPDGISFFGSREFAVSGARPIVDAFKKRKEEGVRRRKTHNEVIVVGLGGGTGFYDTTVGRELVGAGYKPKVVVADLNNEALRHVPSEDTASKGRKFPVTALEADATNLIFPDSGVHLVTSRAVEHYLPEPIQDELIAEAGRMLETGGIYAPQIMTGEPLALSSLSADLDALVGKHVEFFSLEEYHKKVASITHPEGTPIFKEIAVEYAEPQRYEGIISQAERNLTDRFLEVNGYRAGEHLEEYRQEVSLVTRTRDQLNSAIADGKIGRDRAIAALDAIIESTDVYGFFKKICIESIVNHLRDKGIDPKPGISSQGVELKGEGDKITDIALEFQFPVLILEKQAQKSGDLAKGQPLILR